MALILGARGDDKNTMELLSRTGVRVLLWVTVAVPTAWATLWAFERLMFAGAFGVMSAGTMWYFAVWLFVALLAGNAVAYGCDRVLVRLRARSRPLGYGVGVSASSPDQR